MSETKDKISRENHLYLLTAFMVTVALIVLWLFLKPQIVGLIVYTKGILIIPFYWLYSLFKLMGFNYVPLLSELVYSTEHLCKPTNSFFPLICQNNFKEVSIVELSKASRFWNLLIFLGAIPWIKKAYDRFNMEHPAKGFSKNINLEQFIEEQIINHPHLQVFGPLNLSKFDTDKGHFKALDSTYEFAARHDLITGTKERLINITLNGVTKEYNDVSEVVPIIDEEKLLSVLREQLGDLWITIDSLDNKDPNFLNYLSNVDTLLLALYLPVACATDEEMEDEEFKTIKKETQTLINYYWDVVTKNVSNNPLFTIKNQYIEGDRELVGFDYQYLRKRVFKYLNYPVAKKIFAKHAYVKTILCEVVLTARQLGVMPPTDIRWLKLYNRSAFAFIQNIGRPSIFCEGMGPIAHYLIEVKLDKPLEEPDFNIALVGYDHQLLSFAMNEARLKAAEQTSSKMKNVYLSNQEIKSQEYKSNSDKYSDFKYSDDHDFGMPTIEIPKDMIQKAKDEKY